MLPKQYDIQTLRICSTKEEFQKISRKHKGLFTTSMIRHKDYYIFVNSLGTYWQDLSTVHTWNPQEHNRIGENGRFIIGMYSHDGSWELHLTSNTGLSDQNFSMFEDWDSLKNFIISQWKRGWDVTDLKTYDGKYYIVTSYGLNLKQGWALGSKYPQDEINKAYEEGMIITEVTQIEDKYLWIFSGNTGFENQKLEYNPNTEKILSYRDAIVSDNKYDGYSLASIKEFSNKLLFIFVS